MRKILMLSDSPGLFKRILGWFGGFFSKDGEKEEEPTVENKTNVTLVSNIPLNGFEIA